jgi:hypothetical protein
LDFARVIKTVSSFLAGRGHPFAVIGGVSMAAYGMPRTTLDLDLVTETTAQNDLIAFLEARGYETLHRSAGYSNHLHEDSSMGRVDVVYVSGETAREVFANVRRKKGPNGLEVPVPRPEHVIAMKVFAIKNDPSRKFREMEDIRFLASRPGVDRSQIQSYFTKHGLAGLYDEL